MQGKLLVSLAFCLLNLSPKQAWCESPAAAEPIRPALTAGDPAPGKFVKQQSAEFRGSGVYHGLYLPTNWQAGQLYPVIVEYAPNRWQEFSGNIDSCQMGYYLSGGRDFIWVVLPYVDPVKKENVLNWWGSEAATVEYAITNLRQICRQYGGDPNAVLLTGFSRGAIATGYLGLRNEEVADIWLAFLPHSHIDGGKYTVEGAQEWLARTRGRATFVTYGSDDNGKTESPKGAQILRELGFAVVERELAGVKHTHRFLEQDCPIRREMRDWIADVLKNRPGTFAVRGQVVDSTGQGVPKVRVQCGTWHAAVTDSAGNYRIPSLTPGNRKLSLELTGWTFDAPTAEVILADRDVDVARILGRTTAAP